jgi:hypothetical protein
MANIITQDTIDAFNAAMQTVADSLMQLPATINHRTTTLDENGEAPLIANVSQAITCLYQYDVGLGGRYHTIERTDMGQAMHEGWKVYIHISQVTALPFTVDPEADSISIQGTEYELRTWTPSGAFSTGGFQFYECVLHHNTGA